MAETLTGRFIEERSVQTIPVGFLGIDIEEQRREMLFYCEDLEKCISLYVNANTSIKEFINKRISVDVWMADDLYCSNALFYIFEKGHDELMTEVEQMLKHTDNHTLFYPSKFSNKAYELYRILIKPPSEPIPLNLFIEGYREPEYDKQFSCEEIKLLEHYKKYTKHTRLYGHILHQWAIYHCFFVYKSGRLFISTIEGMFKEALTWKNQDDGISDFFDKVSSLLSNHICYGERY